MDTNSQKCTFLTILSIELCACSLIFVAFFGLFDVSPIINIYITAIRVHVAHAVLLLKVWLLVKNPGWNGAARGCGTRVAKRRGWSKKPSQ